MHIQTIDLSRNDLSTISESELDALGMMKNLQVLIAQSCTLRGFPRIDGLEKCSVDLRGNFLIPLQTQEALVAHYGNNIRLDDRQIQIDTFRDSQYQSWVAEVGIPEDVAAERRKALDIINASFIAIYQIRFLEASCLVNSVLPG